MRNTLLIVLGLLFAGGAQAGSTLRCGSKLISTGDLAGEVLDKCGEPVSRDFLGYREVVDYYGYASEVAIEEWIYGPRNGMLYFLRLEGNRLIKIDSKRGD